MAHDPAEVNQIVAALWIIGRLQLGECSSEFDHGLRDPLGVQISLMLIEGLARDAVHRSEPVELVNLQCLTGDQTEDVDGAPPVEDFVYDLAPCQCVHFIDARRITASWPAKLREPRGFFEVRPLRPLR